MPQKKRGFFIDKNMSVVRGTESPQEMTPNHRSIIREGWQAAHDGLLQATGQSRLLESNPALETSIRLRLPYIEPLNLLQVELLKRHRAGEEDPRIKEGIELSINAIATALRNSG